MRLDYPPWNKAVPGVRLVKQFPNGTLVEYEIGHDGEHRRPPRVISVAGITLNWELIGQANDDEKV